MSNTEICKVLNSLYYNLVNEIDNQLGGALDDRSSKLAEALKAAVRDTHNEYCSNPDEHIGY